MRLDRVKLIAEMARQGISAKELAVKSGVSRCTITSMRCGKSCSTNSATCIARALGMDVEELMEREVSV